MCSRLRAHATCCVRARHNYASAKRSCDIAYNMQGHVYYSETDSLERWYKPKWITDVDHVPSEPVCLGKIHVRFEPFC